MILDDVELALLYRPVLLIPEITPHPVNVVDCSLPEEPADVGAGNLVKVRAVYQT